MNARTHKLTMPGAMLERGFWLYVWSVTTPEGDNMLYVGRTGDSSSHKAAPPYSRMGQHLGNVKASNALRAHLVKVGIKPEACAEYQLISHGPIFAECCDMETHRAPRDVVAALEKRLADTLRDAGYRVLNTVNCKKPVDEKLWTRVRDSFVEHFPKIGKYGS
jgi:hypothetical protein